MLQLYNGYYLLSNDTTPHVGVVQVRGNIKGNTNEKLLRN